MKAISTLFLISIILSAAHSLRLEDLYTEGELEKTPESADECYLNFTQIVTKYKYPVELHEVPTKDGYILTIHRIPYGKACKPGTPRIPVFLGHGLFSSSIDYILYGTEQGLGYLLADRCYDVWLGNSRGNEYSRSHKTLTVKDRKFWEFSWHEFGAYDMPAVIDYILKVTGQPDLHYIGVSQGVTQFFVFGSLYPEYHAKIRSAHLMAPVAYMTNTKHELIKLLSLVQEPVFNITQEIGFYDLRPICKIINLIAPKICGDPNPIMKEVCEKTIYFLTGSTPVGLNTTILPLALCHTPAGCSIRQIVHYLQIVGKDYFRQYDYGTDGNIAKYGTKHPPHYDLRKIKIPIALYYGDNDWFADVVDVQRIASELPKVIGKFMTPKLGFGHIDFVYGSNLRSLVHDRIFSILQKY